MGRPRRGEASTSADHALPQLGSDPHRGASSAAAAAAGRTFAGLALQGALRGRAHAGAICPAPCRRRLPAAEALGRRQAGERTSSSNIARRENSAKPGLATSRTSSPPTASFRPSSRCWFLAGTGRTHQQESALLIEASGRTSSARTFLAEAVAENEPLAGARLGAALAGAGAPTRRHQKGALLEPALARRCRGTGPRCCATATNTTRARPRPWPPPCSSTRDSAEGPGHDGHEGDGSATSRHAGGRRQKAGKRGGDDAA